MIDHSDQIPPFGASRPEKAFKILPDGRMMREFHIPVGAMELIRGRRERFYSSIGHGVRKLVAREDILSARDGITYDAFRDVRLITRGIHARNQTILNNATVIDLPPE